MLGNWTKNFLRIRSNEFLVEVPLSFLSEPLVRNWLIEEVPGHSPKMAYNLLCHDTNGSISKQLEETAQMYYYLAHARYILTKDGMREMRTKYDSNEFGFCPRVHCSHQPLLPVGLDDHPTLSKTKCFCPKCRDIYHPDSHYLAELDGAAFGTSFCHLFLHQHLELCPTQPLNIYVPRIGGFKIHKDAPEMKIYRGDRIDV